MNHRLRIAWPLLAVTAAAAAPGCGRHLRAVENPDQVVLDKGRAVLQSSPQAEVVVRPVEVPWSSKPPLLAFHVEFTNKSQADLTFDLAWVDLSDSLGRLRRPIPPQKLIDSFSVARADNPPTASLADHRVTHVRVYRPVVVYRRCAPVYYYHGFGAHAAYDGDPYYEQRQIAAFLAQLLESQIVGPNETIGGFVVFSQELEKDAELVLSVPVLETPAPTATAPAASAPAEPPPADIPRLEFRFEVH